MLYWICPECGHECSPAVRECPSCAAAETIRPEPVCATHAEDQSAALSSEILALVQTFQTLPARPLLAAGSQTMIESSVDGRDARTASTCVLEQEPPAWAETSATPMLPAPDCTEPISALAPELILTDPPSIPVEPHHNETSALSSEPSFADTTALAQALEQEAKVLFEAVTPQPPPELQRADLCDALETEAQQVLDAITENIEAEQSAIRAIADSFCAAPAVLLLSEPSEVLKTPSPPVLEWMRTPRPNIAAASPQDPNLAPVTDGPLKPPLDGPCLVPQLQRFTESGIPRRAKSAKRGLFPAWMISVIVATVLLLGTVSLLQYMNARRDAKPADPSPQGAVPTPAAAAALQEHPFARFVEVAGVRVTPSANRKLQLEYIVVNHSSRELTGLGIRLALRSAGDDSAAPLLTVFSKLPSLGAYQSREIRTELDTPQRAAGLTDWQSVRAETLIAKSQETN